MIPPHLTDRLDDLARIAIAQAEVPGLALAVVDGAGTTWLRTYGLADTAQGVPVTPHTIFEAASLSKPVVALATVSLARQGLLHLDSPLDDYLPTPYLLNETRALHITPRTVLSHLTGLPNWRPHGGALELLRDPQTTFRYSGEAFIYLQRVLEHLTHSLLDQIASEHVFGPLEMEDSAFVWRDDWDSRTAIGHNKAGVRVPKEKPTEANAPWSLHTTAPDLARFVCAFLGSNDEPIPGLAAAMLTPHAALNGPLSWGLGWGLHTDPDGDTLFWHWGDNFGYKAFVAGSPRRALGIVILTNGNGGLDAAERLVVQALPPLVSAFDALREHAKLGYFAVP